MSGGISSMRAHHDAGQYLRRGDGGVKASAGARGNVRAGRLSRPYAIMPTCRRRSRSRRSKRTPGRARGAREVRGRSACRSSAPKEDHRSTFTTWRLRGTAGWWVLGRPLRRLTFVQGKVSEILGAAAAAVWRTSSRSRSAARSADLMAFPASRCPKGGAQHRPGRDRPALPKTSRSSSGRSGSSIPERDTMHRVLESAGQGTAQLSPRGRRGLADHGHSRRHDRAVPFDRRRGGRRRGSYTQDLPAAISASGMSRGDHAAGRGGRRRCGASREQVGVWARATGG